MRPSKQVIVESTNIEFVAKAAFGIGAQRTYLQLTHFVRQRLSRPRNVAIDLVDDVMFGLGRVFHEKVDCLLPGPALVVHPGIHDQPHGAPHLVGECAKLRVRILVQAEVVTEVFTV